MTSGNFVINGYPIWYEKFGTGNEVILLIAGALGSGRSDFYPQLEGQDAFDLRRYTLVAIELAGWGRSRPPARRYGPDVFERDVEICIKLMELLGYNNYSVIGWSDGAKVGLMMAVKNNIRIKCVVLVAVFVKVNKTTLSPILWTRNTKNWSKDIYDSLYPIYGDSLQLYWDEYLNAWRDISDKFPSGYLTDDLALIRCPVLLIHGDQDPLIGLEHPQHCHKYIPDSRLHIFKKGGHNCHQTLAAEFKKVVENFFDECDSCF